MIKKKVGEEKEEENDAEEEDEDDDEEDEGEEEEDSGADGDIKLKKELGLFSAIALIIGKNCSLFTRTVPRAFGPNNQEP